jgi:hypothetical protein
MMRVNIASSVAPVIVSVAVIVKVAPVGAVVAVGVPEMTPADDMVNPGMFPVRLVDAYVYVPLPPVGGVTFWL